MCLKPGGSVVRGFGRWHLRCVQVAVNTCRGTTSNIQFQEVARCVGLCFPSRESSILYVFFDGLT